MTAIVERTVAGGKLATVEVETDAHGWAYAVATVDGAPCGDKQRTVIKLHKPLVSGGTTYTHYVGKLALTSPEAAAIKRTMERTETSAKLSMQDARMRAAKAVYPDAITAKFGGECATTDRSFFAGTPIVKTECGWSIADERTRAAELDKALRRADWLSRAMSHEDSIY